MREDRYKLEVFKDGKVKFEGFGGANDRVASYIVGRDEWTVPKIKVTELLNKLEKSKVFSAPNYDLEGVLCDTGEVWRNGIIKVNKGNQYKEIYYSTVRHAFGSPMMAKIFEVQESLVPTQHLRCGAERGDNDYKNCVDEDKHNFNRAKELK